MLRIYAIALSILALSPLTITASHAQVLAEIFDGYTNGNLTGKVAANGQTWYTPSGGWAVSMKVSSAFALGGSGKGIGNDTSAGATMWSAGYLPLGQTLASGYYILRADLKHGTEDDPGWSAWTEIGLRDAAGAHVQVGWASGKVYLNDLGFSPSVHYQDTGYNTGWLHVELGINLTTKTVSVTWNNPDGTETGTFGPYSYSSAFSPNEAAAMIYGNLVGRGIDNLQLYPAEPPPSSGVLNNMVTELLNISSPPVQPNYHYTFDNPREGWVFIGVDANVTYPNGRMWAALDSAPESSAIFTKDNAWPQMSEAMRFMTAGEHAIDVNIEGDTTLNRLVVRAIPEILYAELGYVPQTYLANYGPYNMLYLRNIGMLDNLNVIVERAYMSENEPYLTDWRNDGKKVLQYSNLLWMPGWDTNPLPQDAYYNYWTSLYGMTDPKYSGIICDEFHISWPWIETNAASAVTRISSEPQWDGHAVYGYSTATLDSFPEGRTFVQAMIGAGYKIAQEQYLDEKATLAEAQANISTTLKNKMQNYLALFPNCQKDFIYTMGYMSAPCETQNVYPNVDFKVYLDMQFNMLATDPVFNGLYGVMCYHSLIADEEMQRWAAKLYRHYCIEGQTTSLSTDPYISTHITNPEFDSGTTGWTLTPAQAGTIAGRTATGFGALQGRFGGAAAGNNVIWTKRKSNAPNKFSQTITGLTPGRLYSLKMFTGDYGAFTSGTSSQMAHVVSFDIQGATVDTAESFHELFKNGCGHNYGAFNDTNPYWMTYHRMVFTANGATATLVVSDWQSDSSRVGPVDQELMHNFVEVQPYLDNIPAFDELPPGAAAAPTDTGAFCRDAAVFNWTPATDNLSGIAGYYVNIGSSAGSGNIWNGYMGNVLTKTITPTVNSQRYYCSVAARDNAGNIGNYSASSDGIRADLVPPVPGTASAPANTTTSPVQVTYSGGTDNLSGIKKVELWYKKEAGGPWTNTGLSSPTASGSFSFALSEGTGTYYFDLVGEDNIGNRSGTPGGNGDTSTVYTLPTYDVTGQLTLEDYPADITLVPVTVELRKHGGSTTTRTIYLGPSGNFTITGVEAGTYDLAFKGPNWLQTVKNDVVVGP